MTNSTDTITLTAWGEAFTLYPNLGYYSNGRLAISFVTEGEPFAHLTVNLPDQHLNEDEFFVKSWSEGEPLFKALLEQGWIIDTGREVASGFVSPKVCRAAGPLAAFIQEAGL